MYFNSGYLEKKFEQFCCIGTKFIYATHQLFFLEKCTGFLNNSNKKFWRKSQLVNSVLQRVATVYLSPIILPLFRTKRDLPLLIILLLKRPCVNTNYYYDSEGLSYKWQLLQGHMWCLSAVSLGHTIGHVGQLILAAPLGHHCALHGLLKGEKDIIEGCFSNSTSGNTGRTWSLGLSEASLSLWQLTFWLASQSVICHFWRG